MRGEKLYLADILEAIDKIVLYTKGLSPEQFEVDKKTVDAVLRNFEVIGEAAGNISEDTRKMAPDLPWPAVISMRNSLIHEYFGADMIEVWKTIQDDLPILRVAVEQILQS